jgi:type I restriction enzyme S subunit
MHNKKFVYKTERYLSLKGAELLKRIKLPRNSVCVSCIGWQMGRSVMTSCDSFTNQQINTIIPDDRVLSDFLYYSLVIRREELLSLGAATGVRTPILNKSAFSSLTIKIPPLPTQQKIAGILSAYDDLIENNTRRIEILEEMARMLYREWFVKFRFPCHEAVQFVESELGLIPEGWEVVKVGDVIELAYGKNLVAKNRVAGKVPVFSSAGLIDYHNQSLVKAPGIVVGRKGNVGSVFWTNEDFHPIDTTFYVKTEICLYYVYYNLKNQNFINNDAAVPGLNRNQAYLLPLIIPPKFLLLKFQEFIEKIFNQIDNLNKKNINLRKTRDLLLPRLISGEIDVENLDINTGIQA